MDDEVTNDISVEPAQTDAAETAATTEEKAPPPPPMRINDLLNFSPKQLHDLARELEVRLYSARSRHYQIVDLVREALKRGGEVTAEGFVDFSAESAIGTLRYPEMNFLPAPEELCVPRAIIQEHELRPAQHIAAKVRLPREREKTFVVDLVTHVEGKPVSEWKQGTDFEKLTPQ